MAQIPDNISSIIKQFLEELEKNNITIDQAILFGSYAQATHTPWSDIDIALVSSDFEGDRFKDRNKIRRIKLKISSDLEPIPYLPHDFTPEDPFVKKIIQTGVTVLHKEPGRATSQPHSKGKKPVTTP